MKRSGLQNRVEYGLARALEGAVGILSPSGADRLGRAAGRLLFSPLRLRRKLAERNLERAFPESSAEWRNEVARQAYEHLGREVIAMIRLSTLTSDAVRRLVEVSPEDWAAFQEANAEGRGVLLATGHYGNWEMAAAGVAARGIPIATIVKRQSNPLVNRRIEEARRALGVETIDMGEAPRRIPRALAAGKGIGIAADQDARHSGIFIPFFGIPASTFRGPALFALRFETPIFAAVCRRKEEGGYRLTGRRLRVERTDSLEDDVARLTAAIGAYLEAEIRADPAQYLWLHNRWKTPPPEEPAFGQPGTTHHGGREAAAS